jgi:thiol-disulfide isomerase/thioredoxin
MEPMENRMNRLLIALPLTLALAAGTLAQATDAQVASPAAAAKATTLTVGSTAPAFKVSGWLKGDAVESLKEGQVYVLEAWATWCGPCRVSIPHLTELQKKFGEKATFVGVAVWEQDWEGVPKFVKEMGDQMDYRVAHDKNGDFQKGWMEPALQSGIPTAFVVNQKGVIAWIGHPMELDGVLPKVIDQTWDLAKAKEASERQAQLEMKRAAIAGQADAISKKIEKALRADNKEEAIGYIDELVALDGEMFYGAAVWKAATLIKDLKRPADAYAYIRTQTDGVLKDNAEALNGFAWCIVDGDEGATRDLALASKLAARADELSKGQEPNVKDTMARVLFLKGDVDGAIKTQEAALALVQDDKEMKDQIQATLDTYRAARDKK